MAKDVFHQQVKNALIKDGLIITNDPLYIRISDAVKVQIDLAAESAMLPLGAAKGERSRTRYRKNSG